MEKAASFASVRIPRKHPGARRSFNQQFIGQPGKAIITSRTAFISSLPKTLATAARALRDRCTPTYFRLQPAIRSRVALDIRDRFAPRAPSRFEFERAE